jgi:hypothetical protein
MANEMITDDGVIIEQMTSLQPIDATMANALARAEIDTQVATAKKYPRSIKVAMDNIISLATLDEQTALECIYALKRGGKPLRGPSIRLAEIIASQWGNCRDAATVITIDRINKMIVAEGAFHDLETNRATKATVQRRISGKDGRLFSDDMIVVTGNAACSIARRNAILAGVPKGIWRRAQEECERVIRKDVKTLVESREAALKALAHFNLSPDQIFRLMEVEGIDDLNLDDVATLRVIYASLKNGEQTVEELLRQIEPEKPARVTAANATMAAPAHFANDGLPSVDAAPAPAKPAGSPPAAVPAPAQAQPTPAAAPAQAQPTLALEPDADEGDAVLDQIGEMLGKVKTPAALDKVWKGLAHLLDGEPERKAKAEALHQAAVERLTPKKQAAE